MSGQVPPASRRSSLVQKRNSTTVKKPSSQSQNGTAAATNGSLAKPTSPVHSSGERTVKKLRLSKALTIPEGTTVYDACRRMAARRIDAVLLTDANALLSGIVTDKDIATRVIAEELTPDQTIVSKIMTRNPTFVTSDSLAIEALQKMVQGKFRHLPVIENGEVIALLDITKCLYDAISRMEKAEEQGSAIAAAVEGVERQWGSNFSAPTAFIEALRERMFKPSLSTIIAENAKVAIVSPSDPVHVAAKRMRELSVSSVIIMTGDKIQGILTSKDILMRVVAQNLSPELTFVEKVMTPNPEYATVDTSILEALHIMHEGKFLHLPVVDKEGCIAVCVDVLQITHAAISMIKVICALQAHDETEFDLESQDRLSIDSLARLRFRMDESMDQFESQMEQCVESLPHQVVHCIGFIKGSILILDYAYHFEFVEFLVITLEIRVDWFRFVFDPGALNWIYFQMDEIIGFIFDPGIQDLMFIQIKECHVVNFDREIPEEWCIPKDEFQRLIFDPGGTKTFQIFVYVFNNFNSFKLSNKDYMCVIAKVANLVCFDVVPDLRTNPFEEEGNDTILTRVTSNGNESIQVAINVWAKEFEENFIG